MIIDGIIDKVSQLKVLKGELEQRRRESDGRHTESLETSATTEVRQVGDITSTHIYGPIKPPQLEITPFSGDVLKWKEFWDAFEASIDKAKYAPIDKLNYLKSKLNGEALEAIYGYQLSNENYVAVVEVLK